MRYDYDLLQKFCSEHCVTLMKDYSQKTKINREIIIEAKCLNCDNTCYKKFREFIKSGCFCITHTSKNTREKMRATCLEKYGVEYSMQSKEVQEKSKATCLENYGVENVFQNEEIKEKMKAMCLEKYGVENAMQSKEIKEKAKATCLEKYGVENAMQSKEIKEKMKATCLEKYGVEHPMQNTEISTKSSETAYKSYKYTFPSGRVETIQGYENHMLNDLLKKEKISEDDIIVSRKEVPEVWYKDQEGKKHRYYVDCLIKSQKRCIEAKSTWTAEKKKDVIFLKQQALKDSGFLCEIWIYNSKGEIVEKK